MRKIPVTLVFTFLAILISDSTFGQSITVTFKAKEVYLGANGAIFYDGFAPTD